ncbi:MAG: glycosyltransferase family 4 protein [Calothrix sp. C42_A2020_038]|nr:glycosyltransferase family 4 protein [Calothrix sp. C42_A2020_038]
MNISIAILFSSYGPYHIARIEGLLKNPQILPEQITAIELARVQEEYPWTTKFQDLGCSVVSLTQDQTLERTNTISLLFKMYQTLNQVNPDAVAIAGYFQPPMLMALFWCLLNGKLPILLSETTEDDTPRLWWRESIKGWIVRKYKSALVGGKPHKRYLMKLGIPDDAIFLGYDVVGNNTFSPTKIKSLAKPIQKPYFLAVNRFIYKKNLSFLIQSYADYQLLVGDNAWDLVLCGDGELRPQIQQQITSLGLENNIHIPGFLQQDELLPYFAHAGCFIHASTQEQWGLVVNEAMAAGLPVIISKRCGCFEDLVIEGINGFGFDPTNNQELISLMLKISSPDINLEQIGNAALEHIQTMSPDYFARGLIQAIEYALFHEKSK